ncbi:MAG TPA: Gldg family protein, partial [Pirellulales bacterium]|nr:Gldg family protein [Pirellulales bacterium]
LIRVQELDSADSAAARQWQQQFPDMVPPCVLVAIDSGPVAGHEVLTARDLAEFHPGDATRQAQVEFFGEQSLTAALARLTAGTKQAQLYMTTGHGELSLEDVDPESRRGLGLLAQMLRQLDCQVVPLDLAGAPRVPHDASLVVVAGGERPWNAAESDKLDVYLRQGGRALILVDFNYDSRRKRPAPCGLEELLSKFGVAVGNDRIVTRNFAGQVETASPALPAAGDHPLVRSLPQAPVILYECRRLSLSTSARQWPGKVVPLLVSHAAPRAWAEGDFSKGALEPGGRNDTDGPVAMALAVERKQERDAAPVLVVAGDAAFVSNRVLSSTAGRVNTSFVLSCVNWLRGRRELLGDIPPQQHEGYRLTGSPDDHRGLVWKSSLLLCALIATSGVTVWTTRRVG